MLAIMIAMLIYGDSVDTSRDDSVAEERKPVYFDLHTGVFRDLALGLTCDFSGSRGRIHPQITLEYSDGFDSKTFYVLPRAQFELNERWFLNLGAGWYRQTIEERQRLFSSDTKPAETRHGAAFDLSTGFKSRSRLFHLTFGFAIKDKEEGLDAKPQVLWGWRF